MPLDAPLRHTSAYREFLAGRRQLLASAMTSLLDEFCPAWLREAVIAPPDPLAGSELDLTVYQSDWDAGRIIATARHGGIQWTAAISIPDLESAFDATSEGLASDVAAGGETLPVTVDNDGVQIPIGPFIVTGTLDEWHKVLDRERAEPLPLSQCPALETEPWTGERIPFPVTNID